MKIWLDAHLSPQIAVWIKDKFQIETVPLRDIGLHKATDKEIFFAARQSKSIIMTKDSDFIDLITRFGMPPQILLINSGNTSNAKLMSILTDALPKAIELIKNGESVIEITEIF
jgi:predicted nuclease of predicted toxin-antitoxin system